MSFLAWASLMPFFVHSPASCLPHKKMHTLLRGTVMYSVNEFARVLFYLFSNSAPFLSFAFLSAKSMTMEGHLNNPLLHMCISTLLGPKLSLLYYNYNLSHLIMMGKVRKFYQTLIHRELSESKI